MFERLQAAQSFQKWASSYAGEGATRLRRASAPHAIRTACTNARQASGSATLMRGCAEYKQSQAASELDPCGLHDGTPLLDLPVDEGLQLRRRASADDGTELVEKPVGLGSLQKLVGFRAIVEMLLDLQVTEAGIRRLVSSNAAAMLGLEP